MNNPRDRDDAQRARRPREEPPGGAPTSPRRPTSSAAPAAPATPAERRLSLAELAGTADVSPRTVRYYVAEGLLPPPVGAGPGSHYTVAHRDRLRLIGELKAAYLPLREIRRRLAGLDDAAVRALLAEASASGAGQDDPGRPGRTPGATAGTPGLDSAAAYLARLGRADRRRTDPTPSAPPGAPVPTPADFPRPNRPAQSEEMPMLAERQPRYAEPARAASEPFADLAPGHPAHPPGRLGIGSVVSLTGPDLPAAPPGGEPAAQEALPELPPEAWIRLPLGDDAELLVRGAAYARLRERVDWLVAWASKVFA